jgi:hypothetical protein
MVLAGIIMLLKSFAVIDVSSVMIFSILFIVYGFASVYISLARHLRGRLFMGTVLFLFGIILLVVHYYEFPGIGIIIFPSILFMLGAGFMMLYIDEAENRAFLIASAILIISSLIYIFFATDYIGEALVGEVWRRDPLTGEESHDPSKDLITTNPDITYKSSGFYGFFDQHYEYQFKIKTTPEFVGTYADIDLVQMLRENKNAYVSPSGYSTDPELSGNQNYTARGTANVPHTSGQFGQIDVNFGVEFIAPPTIVFGAFQDNSGEISRFIPSYFNKTTTGFTLEVKTDNDRVWSGETSIDWIASGAIKVIAF